MIRSMMRMYKFYCMWYELIVSFISLKNNLYDNLTKIHIKLRRKSTKRNMNLAFSCIN